MSSLVKYTHMSIMVVTASQYNARGNDGNRGGARSSLDLVCVCACVCVCVCMYVCVCVCVCVSLFV